MTLRRRLAALERRAASATADGPGFEAITVGLYGRAVPEACEEAIIERAREQNFGGFVCTELFDKDERGRYVCRHCGQLHIADDPKAREYWAHQLAGDD